MKQNQPLTDEEPKPGAAGDNPEPASGNAGTGGEDASGEKSGKESAPEASAPQQNPEDDPAAALEAALQESRQNLEKYLRLSADFENYRRRMAREKEELRQFAVTSFVEEFLPVLDNLAIGLQTAENHPEAANVTAGFRMVAEQIRAILSRQGVEEVDPAGEAFDPHRHESVSSQPDDTVAEGHVSHVVRRGYWMNGRLIRPATVVVSSGPAGNAPESSASEDEQA